MTALAAIALMALTAGDAVTVSVTVDPPVVPFHRQIQYTVTVEAPSDMEVALPKMAEKFGGLSIADTPVRKKEDCGGGRVRITEAYTLDPIFIGYYPVAPVEVTTADGQKVTVPSPGIQVRDLTEEEAAEAMRFEDNAGLISLTKPWYMLWWVWAIPGAIAVLGLVAGLIIFFLVRRARYVAPAVPPWETAYGRLSELDAKHLPDTGDFGPFYVELSTILRSYIEDRFSLHAPERTTPEFLNEASGSGLLSDAHQRRLARFLLHCDRVKFAQYEPTGDEMEQSFALVLHFIDETVPQAEEETEEDAA